MRPLQLKVVCVDAGGFGGPGAGPCQEEQKGSSRRPRGVFGSGAAMRVSTSAVVRWYVTSMCVRLMGIVSTRWATPKDAGSAAATWRKKDRIAAKRALRVVTELFRFSSSSSRKAKRDLDQLFERQRRRLLPQSGGGKEDQHAQGIAIAGHGRGSRIALLRQAPAEIGLQERR